MTRSRIENTKATSTSARRLKEAMLAYHDFQIALRERYPAGEADPLLVKLAHWQSERLKFTHADLYQSEDYQEGLSFLFTDLYSTEDFTDRDRDLERVFPKMVKLLPKNILETVAMLVELNLLTQQLDLKLADTIYQDLKSPVINEAIYCEAYCHCDNHGERLYQIQLTEELGNKLDKYARSSIILFSLKMTEGAAEMAGLGALHQFLSSGFEAFHSMLNVKALMHELSERETVYLNQIYEHNRRPFKFELEV